MKDLFDPTLPESAGPEPYMSLGAQVAKFRRRANAGLLPDRERSLYGEAVCKAVLESQRKKLARVLQRLPKPYTGRNNEEICKKDILPRIRAEIARRVSAPQNLSGDKRKEYLRLMREKLERENPALRAAREARAEIDARMERLAA